MKRFNLSISSSDFKIAMKITKFFGEGSFQGHANIKPGDYIPVLLNNDDKERYLHTMKWGVDIFGTGSLFHNARSENIANNKAWSPLLKKGNRCVIICKGFYLWQATEICDIPNRKTWKEKQPFYIEPAPHEGGFFFIAAIYEQKRKFSGISYGVCALTQDSKNDPEYQGYCNRIPLFLKYHEIKQWLDSKHQIYGFLNKSKPTIIRTKKFLKIGFWIDSPKRYKQENIVLQSRDEWDLELDATSIGLDENFDFDLIDQEAIKQNEANKSGKKYEIKNWDNLRKQKNNNNVNNNYYNHTDHDNDINDEIDELKQEEYKTNNGKKRKRNDHDDENDHVDDDKQPPNKKRKIMNELNLSDKENDKTQIQQKSIKKRNRRTSY